MHNWFWCAHVRLWRSIFSNINRWGIRPIHIVRGGLWNTQIPFEYVKMSYSKGPRYCPFPNLKDVYLASITMAERARDGCTQRHRRLLISKLKEKWVWSALGDVPRAWSRQTSLPRHQVCEYAHPVKEGDLEGIRLRVKCSCGVAWTHCEFSSC